MVKKVLLVLGMIVVLFAGVNTVAATPMDPNADIDPPDDYYGTSSGFDLIPESWSDTAVMIGSIVVLGVSALAIISLPFAFRDWLGNRSIRRKIGSFRKQNPEQQLDRLERRKQRAMSRNQRNTGS